jgi:hypothetical protein
LIRDKNQKLVVLVYRFRVDNAIKLLITKTKIGTQSGWIDIGPALHKLWTNPAAALAFEVVHSLSCSSHTLIPQPLTR